MDISTVDQLDPIVQQWINLFNKQNFTVLDLRKFWSINVPKLFILPIDSNSLNFKFDEKLIDKQLFNRLEQFICASSKPDEKFKSLINNGQHPKLCGRVFKSSEPIFTCRDCSVDSSCVRCVDCFKNSSHKNHKYKVSMSSGSGFCDCGDVEAWKSDPFCDLHKESNEDSIAKLDDDIKERFKLIVTAVVNYCFELLCWENNIDLPDDLESEESLKLNYHLTVVFNDEIHTFDQVISSLTRAIVCSKKDAREFSTLIDREGRAFVKINTFEECKKVKVTIERSTGRAPMSKPLKTEVIQMSIVAHQGFRLVFGEIMKTNVLTISDNKLVYQKVNLLESIIINDANLWKTARNLWHKLFINGMLMNNEYKKFFARAFTKLYDQLMQDFINDNHESTYSIIHLSIQIYSVPSLSHSLIENDDALHLISKTFYKECSKHLITVSNKNTKLQVKRDQTNDFKRSQAVLHDLKYLLLTTPNEWNDNLRKSFLHGFETIIIILKWMQDMDSIVRQVGQHLEFESDFELGIYLQLKMSCVVSQLFEWCSSDFKVLKRSVIISLKELSEKMDVLNYKTWKLCDITCRCIDYDVSSLSVTIHLPLSRAVAGLLLELSKHNVQFSSLDSPLTLIELLELPLRTLVMVSQFRASMWRRNGFSLVNQIIFYHSPSFREEMFDKDIIMMQYVASLLNPDEYLIHLLNKFGLMFWIQDNYEENQRKQEEDFIRQTSVLVEEFLNLLLIIISERTPGVGNVTLEDKIKKEIIQWLCVESRTHSDLLRNLSKHSSKIPIESLINEVAIFKKQSDSQSGKYELKEEYYKEFNPFFYHYTRTDQCSAEDKQLKRKKQNKEKFVVCHPPIPPELTEPFKPLRNLLNSKIFLHLVKTILERVCDEKTRSFSENQYEKTLHLIGVALHEEKRDLDNSSIDEENKFNFIKIANDKIELIKLLEQCKQCHRVNSHNVLTSWVLDKIKSLVEERAGKNETIENLNNDNKLNDLVKLDKESNNSSKRNSSMAAVLRQKIMAQMSAMQNKFIEENLEYFQNEQDEQSRLQTNNSPDDDMNALNEINSDSTIALGNERRGKYIESETFFCMLCREQEDLNLNSTCMVLAAFAQRSTVLSKNRKRKILISQRKKNQTQDTQQLTMSSDLYCGTHVSTCGHIMHAECFDHYFESVKNKERRRPIRYGRHGSFNVENNEYLCPLCECLSNTVIPLIPATNYRNYLRNPKNTKIKINMNDWLLVMFNLVSNSRLVCENYGSVTKRKIKLDSIDKIVENLNLDDESKQSFKLLEEIYTENADMEKKFDTVLKSSIKKSSKSINTVETGRELDELDNRSVLFSHWSCSFTIQSLEKLLREEYKPTFGDLSSRNYSSLQVLIRYCSVNSIIYDFNSIRNHCIDLLNYLLLNEKYNLNPSSILDVDAFSILVSLVLTSTSLFIKDDDVNDNDKFKIKNYLTLPLGNVNDQYLVQLMVLFHIVQIILTQDEFYQQVPMESDDNKEIKNSENRSIAMFYVDILKVAGIKSAFNDVKQLNNNLAENISSMLKSKLLPFLRCVALLYHFLTEIMPPKKLTDIDLLQQNSAASSIEDIEEKEFVILCEYLALPKKLSELFKNVSLVRLAQSWARHPRINLIFEENEKLNLSNDKEEPKYDQGYLPFKLIKQPHTTNHLIELPEDYTELINNVALLPCPSSNDLNEARCSTLCLVCGAMLCSNSLTCFSCKQDVDGENYGACNYHAIGTNDCKILLLAGKSKGCFLEAPYVDEYGETDTGLRRGNPLRLSRKKYNKLNLLWLKNGIAEQVARIMETGTSNIETRDWNLY